MNGDRGFILLQHVGRRTDLGEKRVCREKAVRRHADLFTGLGWTGCGVAPPFVEGPDAGHHYDHAGAETSDVRSGSHGVTSWRVLTCGIIGPRDRQAAAAIAYHQESNDSCPSPKQNTPDSCSGFTERESRNRCTARPGECASR